MKVKNYCTGSYFRIQVGQGKTYVACLFTLKGNILRHSRIKFKTATLAKAHGTCWAERVNLRAAGRYTILHQTSSILRELDERQNVFFEDLG